MWRYQTPGFETLLLEELQRQQRCSQFCDTVLRADGVSVPAHSCILSALSPELSCALSSTPPPPSGQSHLLEFPATGACALLRLVGLLYSGEMVGEGEVERKEVMAVAAKLGIRGLVEVRKRDEEEEEEEERKVIYVQRSERRAGPRRKGVSQRDVGVQTEPLRKREAQTEREKDGERERKGKEEEREGDTLTRRIKATEKPYECEKDTGTQTCELDPDASDADCTFSPRPLCSRTSGLEESVPVRSVQEDPPITTLTSHTALADPDVDVTTTQGSGTPAPPSDPLLVPLPPPDLLQTPLPPPDPLLVSLSPDIPYIPLSQLLLYPPAENHTHPDPHPNILTPPEELDGSTPIYIIPPSFSSIIPPSIPSASLTASDPWHVAGGLPPFTSDPPQTWGTGPPGGSVVVPGEGTEEFDRFEGNIPGFISYFLNSGQLQEEGQRGRRGRGRRTGARRGGAERRARRPKGGARGRTKRAADVDPAVVEVSQRGRVLGWGVGPSRTGVGGGVIGCKLYLKTRELLQKPIKIHLKRRGRGKMWEVTGVEEKKGGASGRSRKRRSGQRNAEPQLNQDGFPVIKRQRGRPRVKPLPFPPLPRLLYNALTYDPPSSFSAPTPSPPPAPIRSPVLSPTTTVLSPTAPSLSPVPSPAAPYLSPAPALLHTAPLPPLATLPLEDPVEQFDRLLEDIMMDLAFLPTAAVATQQPNDHQSSAALPHGVVATAAPCAAGPVSEGTGGERSAGVKTTDPGRRQQQQAEGELCDILDHFLWSFEQQVAGARTETGETEAPSHTHAHRYTNSHHGRTTSLSEEPYTLIRNYSGAHIQTSTAEHRAQTSRASERKEEQRNTHTADTSASPRYTPHLGHRNAHTHTYVSTVVPSAYTHHPLSLTHTAPPLRSPSPKGVRLGSTAPPASVSPRNREKGRRTTRRQARDDLRSSEEAGRGERRSLSLQGQTEELTVPPPSRTQPSQNPPSHTTGKPKAAWDRSRPPTKKGRMKKTPVPKKPIGVRRQPHDALQKEQVRQTAVGVVRPEQKQTPPGAETHTLRKRSPPASRPIGTPEEVRGRDGQLEQSRSETEVDPPTPVTRPTKTPQKARGPSDRPTPVKARPDVESLSGKRPPPASQPTGAEDNAPTAQPITPKNISQSKVTTHTTPPPPPAGLSSRERKTQKRRDRRGGGERKTGSEPEEPERRGKKRRRAESEEERKDDREESGKGVIATSEEEVDVVTQVTPSSEFRETREVLQEDGEGERERGGEWTTLFRVGKVEEDSDESVDVVGDGEETEWGGVRQQNTQHLNPPIGERKAPTLLHSRIVTLPVARSSREAAVGSTGSWEEEEEEEEEEVDVLGVYSPLPVPLIMLPGTWGEGLGSEEEEEEEEEEEIDVIGGEFDHGPSIVPSVSSLL